MKITINGQAKEVANAHTIADIVGQFCKNSKNIMTEVNGNIVTNNHWDNTPVKEGDTIELVVFVGGG